MERVCGTEGVCKDVVSKGCVDSRIEKVCEKDVLSKCVSKVYGLVPVYRRRAMSRSGNFRFFRS